MRLGFKEEKANDVAPEEGFHHEPPHLDNAPDRRGKGDNLRIIFHITRLKKYVVICIIRTV